MGQVTAPFQFTYTGIILICIATKVMAGHEVPFFAVPTILVMRGYPHLHDVERVNRDFEHLASLMKARPEKDV